MEGKTPLIYIIGHLAAGQMVMAQTAENMAGMHAATQRLSAKLDEIVVAKLERQGCPCPDIPVAASSECCGGPLTGEFYWPEHLVREVEMVLLPRHIPKLAQLEKRVYHEPQPFRGYMNGKDTRRRRW